MADDRDRWITVAANPTGTANPTGPANPTVAVIGEALLDMARQSDGTLIFARPGGSPLNVAVALARLGQPTALMARFSLDEHGRKLRAYAQAAGLDLRRCLDVPDPSTIAEADIGVAGIAQYRFRLDSAADFAWTDTELSVPETARIIHFGSLASWLAPGCAAIDQRMAQIRAAGEQLVSYDPNLRPLLQADRAQARAATERSIAHAHIVKASADDLAWAYPAPSTDAGANADTSAGTNVRLDTIAARWLSRGPSLVVITDGVNGATAYCASAAPRHRPTPQVVVVDTVGAGDAFTAGLLDGLLRRGVHTPGALAAAVADPAFVTELVDAAAEIAAIGCTREGANPPRRDELGNRTETQTQ